MQELQGLIQSKGEEILKRMDNQKVSLFSKDFWYGSIMDWSMKNEAFKTQMFRFVDVLPSLQSGTEVAQHLKEYFADAGEELPPVFNVGLGLGSLAPGLMAGAIRKNVTQMAKMFITGENPEEALPVLRKSRSNKITFTVDILGEATLSEKEALDYQRKYLELIDGLARDAQKWNTIDLIDRDHRGEIPKVNVSVKLTALSAEIKDSAWETTKEKLKSRLRPILEKAIEKKIFLNLDMEHYAVKDLTLEVWKELLLEPQLKTYPFFGCVIQAYLRDSLKDLQGLVDYCRQRGTPMTIRLVKGAYWDSETIEAEQKRWQIPVYTNKQETDANYERCAELLMSNHQVLHAAFGSHNVRTIAACLVLAEKNKVPREAFEIQMLYGMADPIKKALVEMNYRVREYAPVGELIPGMAYLVRRLLENTSNESWLRGKFADGLSTEKLLASPHQDLVPTSADPSQKDRFYNEAPIDFAVEKNRISIKKALESARTSLTQAVPLFVNGKEIVKEKKIQRENPSATQTKLAVVSCAETTDGDLAIQTCLKGSAAWKRKTFAERAALLDRLADLMVRDRWKLMATQILEVGKTWAEADGDVAEAIDFCRYYAREARKMDEPQKMGQIPGESSLYIYQPRGITAVIAPWNFPFAILTGMTTAALVTGNPVLIKPAEQSSLTAWGLVQLLREAGFPTEIFHFLPGIGEEIGAFLVSHPEVHTVAFTGSKAVGLAILKETSQLRPGQKHLKRAILELGGKNAVIVDSDADLDEAVDGVVHSAFGFAGQKCSAASRVIVLKDIYEKFCDRLVETTKTLKVGPAWEPENDLGPVVDQEALLRIRSFIEAAKTEAKLVYQAPTPEGGHFVGPTIFTGVNPQSKLAQEEIFGPVLAVIEAKDLNHALEIANGTDYALTGGLYSRSPLNIERVKTEFQVGNLYINRGITGALVERHPFGGFKMSGIGSKAGGPDYLKQFTEPRCVTENMMRRGFAPTDS